MSWETQILNEYLVSSILFILLKFLSSLAILDGPELSILFLSQLGSYRRPQLVVDSAFRTLHSSGRLWLLYLLNNVADSLWEAIEHLVNLSSEWSFLMLSTQDSQYSVGTLGRAPIFHILRKQKTKNKKKHMGFSLTGEKMKEEGGHFMPDIMGYPC